MCYVDMGNRIFYRRMGVASLSSGEWAVTRADGLLGGREWAVTRADGLLSGRRQPWKRLMFAIEWDQPYVRHRVLKFCVDPNVECVFDWMDQLHQQLASDDDRVRYDLLCVPTSK